MLAIKQTDFSSVDSEYAQMFDAVDKNDLAGAIKAHEDFIKKYPDYAPAYNNLASFYYTSGENDLAQKHFEKAYSLNPDDPIIQKNLADFYFAVVCRPLDAMNIYIKALKSNPEDVETLLIIGNISALIENFEDAKFFYNKVLEIEPWNITAMDNLDALQEIEKIVKDKKGAK